MISQKGIPDCPQYRKRILLDRRDITPDPAKDLGAPQGPESAGNLLLDFSHAYIPFRLVVPEGNPKIEHEIQRLRPIFIKTLQQVSRFGFFKPAPLALGPRPDFEEWIFMIPKCDDAAVTLLEINKLAVCLPPGVFGKTRPYQEGMCRNVGTVSPGVPLLCPVWSSSPRCGRDALFERRFYCRFLCVGSWFS